MNPWQSRIGNRQPTEEGEENSLLKKGEGVLLISKNGNLMQFVTPSVQFYTVNTAEREVHVTIQTSERFKIRGGTWSPLMLANYAEQVGYRIIGIKRFEWYFKEYRDAA